MLHGAQLKTNVKKNSNKSSLFVSLILINVLLSCYALSGSPTFCGPHKGNEVRCSKTDMGEDVVVITSLSDKPVYFQADQWSSFCGLPGKLSEKDKLSLEPSQSIEISFKKAKLEMFGYNIGSNFCQELFVYQCFYIDNSKPMYDKSCLSLLKVEPKH